MSTVDWLKKFSDDCKLYGCTTPDSARLLAAANEMQQLRVALKPFADLADRQAYTLDDVPHKWCIDAKLALNNLRVVNGAVQQDASK